VRAPARKPRWLNPAPCTAAKGMYLVGARKQELPGATLLSLRSRKAASRRMWARCRTRFTTKLGAERFYRLSYSSGPIAHAHCSWPGA
jgi:hypothetical protein